MKESTVYDAFRKHLEKIITISDPEFERAISYFTVRAMKKKEYLLRPMQVCRYESYIIKGLFQSCVIDDSGNEHSIYFPHEDWWVSDLKSFISASGSAMQIQALEDALLLQVSKTSLTELYKVIPQFEKFFRILNENAFMALQERVEQQYSSNAAQQYADFLVKYPSLHNRLSQKRIASFLGVTPEWLSQLLKK